MMALSRTASGQYCRWLRSATIPRTLGSSEGAIRSMKVVASTDAGSPSFSPCGNVVVVDVVVVIVVVVIVVIVVVVVVVVVCVCCVVFAWYSLRGVASHSAHQAHIHPPT